MKILKLIIVFLLFAGSAFAQESLTPTGENKYAFSLTPQYVITGGMRLDFDFKINEKGWLTLAPIFYYMDDTYMYAPESTSYTGLGGFLNYRYFPTGKGVYAAAGLNYRLLNTQYSSYVDYDYSASSYAPNPGSNSDEKEAQFNTFGFDFTFGYQFRLVEQLFMDLYLGWGFRYSLQDSEEDESYWSDAILDLGYSGFLPVAGLRIGLEF